MACVSCRFCRLRFRVFGENREIAKTGNRGAADGAKPPRDRATGPPRNRASSFRLPQGDRATGPPRDAAAPVRLPFPGRPATGRPGPFTPRLNPGTDQTRPRWRTASACPVAGHTTSSRPRHAAATFPDTMNTVPFTGSGSPSTSPKTGAYTWIASLKNSSPSSTAPSGPSESHASSSCVAFTRATCPLGGNSLPPLSRTVCGVRLINFTAAFLPGWRRARLFFAAAGRLSRRAPPPPRSPPS